MAITLPSPTSPLAPSRPTAYKWWVVFMLWFVCFFNYADRQLIFSIFPTLELSIRHIFFRTFALVNLG